MSHYWISELIAMDADEIRRAETRIKALEAENERLRAALKIFEDENSWRDMKDGGADPWDGRLFDTWALDSDPVAIARAALAQGGAD